MATVRRALEGHGLLWIGIGLLAAALVLTVAAALYGSRAGGADSGNFFGGTPGGSFGTDTAGADLSGAREAAERAVESYGNPDLQVGEVMEFANNYYAQVEERDTDRFVMELLINKRTGEVSPEPGPNMMWNTKYGMMGGSGMMGPGGGMMGNGSQTAPGGRMPIGPEEAKQIAGDYLERVSPGAKAVESDAFYGYYTLHAERDGEITGMLSVNGYSGEVWYHNWHGPFVAMEEGEDSH